MMFKIILRHDYGTLSVFRFRCGMLWQLLAALCKTCDITKVLLSTYETNVFTIQPIFSINKEKRRRYNRSVRVDPTCSRYTTALHVHQSFENLQFYIYKKFALRLNRN
jgi:hypothetical protein